MLEDVAATLGHRPWAVLRRVSLALGAPGIIAGLLLTWLRAFGEFGATVMVAYHPYSLPVYTYVAFGSQGLPRHAAGAAAHAGGGASYHGRQRPCRRRVPPGAGPPLRRCLRPPFTALSP